MSTEAAGLGRRMAKSAVWSIGTRVAIKFLGVISISILARLLTPADFGLVATATAFVGIIQVLSEFSFDLALIRDQKAGRAEYDTVWTMTIIRGAVTGLILAAGAGAIADFFGDARLEPIMWALAASTLVDSFSNVRVVDFRKDLNFRKDFVYMVTAKVASFLVTVTFAFAWRNYWALVAGNFTATFARVALGYALAPYLPRFTLAMWRDITDFSKWFLVSNIINYIGQRSSTFIIGKINGPTSVGLYTAAVEIAGLVSTEFLLPIFRVLNPGFSKLGDDLVALREALLNVLSLSSLIAFPAVVGIGIVADPLVRVFLGPAWLDTIPLIRVLVIGHVIWLSFSIFFSAYLATGNQRTIARLVGLNVALVVPGMTVGVWYLGPIGAAYASLVVACVVVFANITCMRRLLGLKVRAVAATFWRPLLATLAMGAVVGWCIELTAGTSLPEVPALNLAVLVLIGATSYPVFLVGLWAIAGKPKGGESILLDLLHRQLRARFHRAS